jgi:hypothetical protein
MSGADVITAGPRASGYEAEKVSLHCMNMFRIGRQAVDKKMCLLNIFGLSEFSIYSEV